MQTIDDHQNPYAPPKHNPDNRVTLPEVRFLKSWSIFALIAGLGGMLAGGLLGGGIGVVMGAAGASAGQIQVVTGILGLLIGLPISYYTYKWTINKYILTQLF